MNCLVVAGFLGSGKTTFILNLARKLSRKGGKVAILENEVGTAPIDGAVLKQHGLVVKELFAGCVCCSLQQDLVAAVEEIRGEVKPDVLLIEPTGIAAPGMVVHTLRSCRGHDDHVVSVVVMKPCDPSRSKHLNPFLEGSIRDADHLILNSFGRSGGAESLLGDSLSRHLTQQERTCSLVNAANYAAVATWYTQTNPFSTRTTRSNAPQPVQIPQAQNHLVPGLAGVRLVLDREEQLSREEAMQRVRAVVEELGHILFAHPSAVATGHIKAFIHPHGIRINATDSGNGVVQAVTPASEPDDGPVQRIDLQMIVFGVESEYLEGLLNDALRSHFGSVKHGHETPRQTVDC